MRRNLLLISGSWLICGFAYYLINFYTKYIPGNILENAAFSTIADICSNFLSGITYQYFGGNLSIISSYLISSLSGVILLAISNMLSLIPFVLFFAKLGVSSAFNLLYILNIDLFPADVRSTTFGICNIYARLAGIFAPLVAETSEPLPLIFFILSTFTYAIISSFVIEVKNSSVREKNAKN